jgi:hypothetical protein
MYQLLGMEDRAEECNAFIRYWSRAVWGDAHALFEPVVRMIREGPFQALICGHSHVPGAVDLGERRYINAGAWTFGAAQYATWDGAMFDVADRVTGDSIGVRHYQWMLSGHEPGDFFAWWRTHYRGWLRFVEPERHDAT